MRNSKRGRPAGDLATSLDPSARTVSATEAAKNFGRLVDRVRDARAVYVIERAGTPVARIIPVVHRPCSLADLVALLESVAPAEAAFLDAVESGVRALNRPAVPDDRWAR